MKKGQKKINSSVPDKNSHYYTLKSIFCRTFNNSPKDAVRSSFVMTSIRITTCWFAVTTIFILSRSIKYTLS